MEKNGVVTKPDGSEVVIFMKLDAYCENLHIFSIVVNQVYNNGSHLIVNLPNSHLPVYMLYKESRHVGRFVLRLASFI